MKIAKNVNKLILFSLVAYFLVLLFRFSLAFLAKEHPEFLYDGKIISLWTADAGLYGYYAKELLHGAHYPFDPEHALGFLLFFFAKFFDLDTVIFYLPAFLSSLIVVPIILIFWLYDRLEVGFVAAIIGGIAMNYYFRTHMGYCDTDMIIFPLFFTLLFSMIAVVERGVRYSIIGALAIVLLLLFYHSAKPIVYGSLIFFTFYLLLFGRRDQSIYLGALVLFAAALPLHFLWSLTAAVLLYGAALFIERRWRIDYKILLAFFVILALGVGAVAWKRGYFQRALEYLNKKQEYILKDRSKSKVELEATLKTIAESRAISFKELVTYSSGNILLFITGTIGLLLLGYRRRSALLLLLPYLVGLLSLKAGVRFTTFAAPVLVVGNVYLLYLLKERFSQKRFALALFYLPSLALLLFYLNILNAYNHMLSPFFKHGELQAIKSALNKNDRGYILTWWDYGWPLWYYTNKRTLIDNGKHHWDNYIVAKSLFSSDLGFVARFDRFFVERYDRIYPWAILPYILNRYPLKELESKLRSGEIREKKRNEIYYYFDDKILTKLPVIEEFAYLKGEKKKGFVWIDLVRRIDTSKGLLQGKAAHIDLGRGILEAGGQRTRVGRVIFHDGEKIVKIYRYSNDPYTIIVYKKRYIVGTSGYGSSFFFRAFFYGDLDKRLFERVIYNKSAKIYRLRG